MQACLTFQFPHNQKQVTMQIFVPQPEARPRTVANFVFMCTGELPPPDMLDALRLPRTAVAFATSADARAAGLKPFAETAVVRVEKRVMLEIGGSTSKSIFGGFIPDEPLANATSSSSAPTPQATAAATAAPAGALGSIAATLPQLKAGTVLCGNVGMPDSHASRYYILLSAVSETERPHYACYTPLGMVTSGLEQLVDLCRNVPVQPRSLEPLKRVALTAAQLDFNFQHLLTMGAAPNAVGSKNSLLTRNPLEMARGVARVSGRVRRRDEDDDNDSVADVDAEEDGGAPERGGGKGFFHFEARFPRRLAGGRSGQGPAVKRLRTEGAAVAVDEDGFPILRNTAVEDAEEEGPATAGGGRKGFNYFNAQEAAFLNDIDLIKEKQQVRTYHRMSRMAKHASSSGSSGTFGTLSSRKIRERALQSQESRVKGKRSKQRATRAVGKGGGMSAGPGGATRREVKKRY